ncbi:two component transcriptional regulator, winged helix family [Treponema primitia ZAS-2]|uniref:Phosphate regulon transcriptional regulatory protein PhoB n=1 Tax=Treponema primitia (strain ATCC BAA-887 / DSM 12427 / ZAS-2) TaxID=545694 RepID=F5YKR0_TREPZ|nr:response regulator transcription factor [Treponema primitia]AEF86533.1 two component transcriptional regulator, winged helix family [Treponema primitia ZAS-2]
MNTVLVVDDEAKILDIVKSYLEKSGYRALTAGTGKEALAALRSNKVSLLLLDLMLPDFSGEELCRKVRSESDMPIIMMTAKVDEESIIRGLRIGADDYVTKPFSPRQLMARVAAALRRADGPSSGTGPGEGRNLQRSFPRILSWEALSADTGNRRVTKNGATLPLTPNEYKILILLMSRPQKIFTRDEIIDSIKGDDYDGFDRAIDSHIKNLRQKIEDDPRSPRYILTVYGMGYRFGGEDGL